VELVFFKYLIYFRIRFLSSDYALSWPSSSFPPLIYQANIDVDAIHTSISFACI